MPSLFKSLKHPDESLVYRYNQVKTMLRDQVGFDPKIASHTQLICECSNDLKKKLVALKHLDQRIVAGFVLSATAFGLSFILPLVTISIIGFLFSVYCLIERMNISPNYRYSLMTLEGCMEWVFKEEEKKVECNEVQNMLKVAVPLMSEKQLTDIINNRDENKIIAQAKEIKEKNNPVFLGYSFKEDKTIEYDIYGFQKGKPEDVIAGLLNLARKGWNAAQKAVMSLNRDSQQEVLSSPRP